LNFDKFSKYLVRDINVAKVLDSPERSIVKLFSLHEDCVSSIDMVWNMGLSSTSTVDNTVRLWDIEVGKCLNKTMINDYAIVGSHIENSPGFLLNSIMIREVKASLFVWDCRDFLNPLNFCVGNLSTFHSVQFNDNKFCVSDCFNERLFDLRMIAGSSPD
jgi:WD40 repeat protein